jgi:hypothetical protein
MKFILLLALIILLWGQQLHGAVNDTVTDCQSIAVGARLDIQPSAGTEWMIFNLFWNGGPVTLERFDGTDNAAFLTLTGPGWQNIEPGFRVTNTNRIRVLNAHDSSQVICYDGVQSK